MWPRSETFAEDRRRARERAGRNELLLRGAEFGFKTKDTTWRYRFEPSSSGGTDVTESFETPKYGVFIGILAPAKKREPALVEGMQTTLQRLKAAAEGSVAP